MSLNPLAHPFVPQALKKTFYACASAVILPAVAGNAAPAHRGCTFDRNTYFDSYPRDATRTEAFDRRYGLCNTSPDDNKMTLDQRTKANAARDTFISAAMESGLSRKFERIGTAASDSMAFDAFSSVVRFVLLPSVRCCRCSSVLP